MIHVKNVKIWLFVIFSMYIILFSYADSGLFSWFIADEGLWANDAKWMVLWDDLPEDGFAQSLLTAPLFYLMEYYVFRVFGVSYEVFHILLAIWGIFILYILLFLLKYDGVWAFLWASVLMLFINMGFIDIIPLSLLMFAFYLSFRENMYMVSSVIVSVAVLFKYTTLPYAILFMVYIAYILIKRGKYKEMLWNIGIFIMPIVFHLYFIKNIYFYFYPLIKFHLLIKSPLWVVVNRAIFNHFTGNPLFFLFFPLLLFFLIENRKKLNEEDIFLIVWVLVGIGFYVLMGQVYPRRILYWFFPIFVLSEKGLIYMKGSKKELIYIMLFTPFIVISANILRKNKWEYAFMLSKNMFYVVYFLLFLFLLILVWKKRWYKHFIIVLSVLTLVWNISHISYKRLSLLKELEHLEGYIISLEPSPQTAHIFVMNAKAKPIYFCYNGLSGNPFIYVDDVISQKIIVPYKYILINGVYPSLKIKGYKLIYRKDMMGIISGIENYTYIYEKE